MKAIGEWAMNLLFGFLIWVARPFEHRIVTERNRCRRCSTEWTKAWDLDDPYEDFTACPACGSLRFEIIDTDWRDPK